jgi:hypothetical protein
MAADKERYFNFPVPLLQGAFNDIRTVMSEVMDYAGYVHTLKLEHGTDEKKMNDAGGHFGISWGNALSNYRTGKKLFESFPENSPKAGINKDRLFDFYKNPKTDEEIAVLLAFLALKSIIGAKPYSKATNQYLIARMGGYVSINEMPEPLPLPLAKFTTRRKLDKIKYELQANWSVNIYAQHTHGFYVSIDHTFTLDKLVFEAEKRKQSNKEKFLKQRKEEARLKALNKLKI